MSDDGKTEAPAGEADPNVEEAGPGDNATQARSWTLIERALWVFFWAIYRLAALSPFASVVAVVVIWATYRLVPRLFWSVVAGLVGLWLALLVAQGSPQAVVWLRQKLAERKNAGKE